MKLTFTIRLISLILTIISLINFVLNNDASVLHELIFLVTLALVGALYWVLHSKMLKPIQQIRSVTKTILKNEGEQQYLEEKDIAQMVSRVVQQAAKADEASMVINALKAGDLTEDISLRAGFTENNLLQSLNAFRLQLQSLKESEKERNWAGEGMAKFVDTLKADYKNETEFYDKLISNIVTYMGANQGGFFIVNNNEAGNDKHLSLVSCYAYERKKFLTKRIEIGQGLLGQAYLEGQTVILRDVPKEYISITSGLGHAIPGYLMIVPLKVNDTVECLIEIASFQEFKPYQVQFLEKVGESIASTVSSMRVSEHTKNLLKETQVYAEQLKAQEEEMRQSMEELTATQEEMARKEKELQRLLSQSTEDQAELKNQMEVIERLKEEGLRESNKMLEYQERYKQDIIEILNQIPAKIFLKDSKGNMVLCNKIVADGYNLPIEKVIGTHDYDHFDAEQVKIWVAQEQEIFQQGKKTFVQEERMHDRLRYLQTTKMPFTIKHLDQVGIMGFQFDVTDTFGAERIEKELREEIAMLRKNQA